MKENTSMQFEEVNCPMKDSSSKRGIPRRTSRRTYNRRNAARNILITD